MRRGVWLLIVLLMNMNQLISHQNVSINNTHQHTNNILPINLRTPPLPIPKPQLKNLSLTILRKLTQPNPFRPFLQRYNPLPQQKKSN